MVCYSSGRCGDCFKLAYCIQQNLVLISQLLLLLLLSCCPGGVPGVFRTPFQTRPLDLGTDAFYTSRKDAVDALLQEVAEGGAGEGGGGQWHRVVVSVLVTEARGLMESGTALGPH